MASICMIAACVSLFFVILFISKNLCASSSKLSLPPGPKGLPIVGNILDMPTEQEWKTFAQWGETWGDICSVTVLGQPLVILNSAQAAFDMLDKKSSIYSDRPVLQMGGELVGWKNTLALLPYGERFRRYRKLFHNLIGTPASASRFHSTQEQEIRAFLRRLLTKPSDLATHVRSTTGAVILRISYGYEIEETNDPFIELADRATEQFSLSVTPGAFLVDVIPVLRHVPAWFPGADFKRKAECWAGTLREMVDRPYNFVKQQVAKGKAPVSFSSTLLEEKVLSGEEEFDLKWCSASLYSGAADTTVSALYSFFLAMILHPTVAQNAQAELDRVVGSDRLPTFADRPFLPYMNALVMEVFRWHTVVPTAVPHRVMQDDIHEGYLIPKGSLIIPNIWKFTHDSRIYQNPFEFNPERFMASKDRPAELDPRRLSFGFGRRSCPGLHLADSSVFITCAATLAVYNVNNCGEGGQPTFPVHEYTTGTISHPKKFRCVVVPRSEKARELIQVEC